MHKIFKAYSNYYVVCIRIHAMSSMHIIWSKETDAKKWTNNHVFIRFSCFPFFFFILRCLSGFTTSSPSCIKLFHARVWHKWFLYIHSVQYILNANKCFTFCLSYKEIFFCSLCFDSIHTYSIVNSLLCLCLCYQTPVESVIVCMCSYASFPSFNPSTLLRAEFN